MMIVKHFSPPTKDSLKLDKLMTKAEITWTFTTLSSYAILGRAVYSLSASVNLEQAQFSLQPLVIEQIHIQVKDCSDILSYFLD